MWDFIYDFMFWLTLVIALGATASLWGIIGWEWARCIIEERRHKPVSTLLTEGDYDDENCYGPQIIGVVLAPMIAFLLAAAWWIVWPVGIVIGTVWYLRDQERTKKALEAAFGKTP